MLQRQRGAYNLAVVAIVAVAVAGGMMAALMSVRQERNYFAEGVDRVRKLAGDSPAAAAVESARGTLAQNDGKMRRCIIDGKTVISNVDCSDKNPTSKVIKIQETKGFEAPKKPAEPPPEAGQPTPTDKMIEKQLR
jgi:hypothetical protein